MKLDRSASAMTRIFQVAFLTVLAASGCVAQQAVSTKSTAAPSATYVGKAIGKATVDRTPSLTTINLYANQDVLTDTANHLHVISRGNTIIFTPNSNFHTRVNGFDLNDGGTKVASYTGMTAFLPNCFSVSPVDPNLLTLYEVDWLDKSAAVVYARSQNVNINYYVEGAPRRDEPMKAPTKSWTVKEGHFARIPDVPACKPILYFGPENVWPVYAATVLPVLAVPEVEREIWRKYPELTPTPLISQASP